MAYIQCTPWRSYDGGDHVLHVGEVCEYEFGGGDPLLFFSGKFRGIGEVFDALPWIESLDCPSSLSRVGLFS